MKKAILIFAVVIASSVSIANGYVLCPEGSEGRCNNQFQEEIGTCVTPLGAMKKNCK